MGKGLGIAALLFTCLAIASSGVCQYLPLWVIIDTGVADASGNYGLWRLEIGTAETDWLEAVSSGSTKTIAKVIRYMMLAGGVFLLLSLLLVSVFVCGEGRRGYAIAAAIINLISVMQHVASIALFHIEFEPETSSSYGGGFYLAIVAASLAFVGCILKVAAAVSVGNKVDAYDRKRGPPPSTRINPPTYRGGQRRR